MNLARIFGQSSKEKESENRQSYISEAILKILRPIQKSRKNYIELESLSVMLKDILSEQNQHLESFSATVTELASSADEISNTNKSVVSLAKNSLKDTEEGFESVTQLKDLSVELNKEQVKFKELISIMNSIRETTTLINDVVFQTKLLSFNASVEAARAGEHGKGFAVVAEEMKNLADSSKKAADAIFNKIEGGIASVDELVKVFSGGIDKLVESTEVTTKKFENIRTNVTHLSTSVGEIAIGVNNQSAAINSTLSTLHKVTKLNQRNAQFSLFSVTEISKDLENSIEEASELTKESLEVTGTEITNSMLFWDEVDKVLRQIKGQSNMMAALQTIATKISQLSSWKVVHVMVPDENDVCESAKIWSNIPLNVKSSNFYSMSTKAQFSPGKGLPGRVFSSKHYEYIENVVLDNNFPRQKAAEEIGLVSGMGVPILNREHEVIAVVEFFSYSLTKIDPMLLEAVGQMGQLVGAKAI